MIKHSFPLLLLKQLGAEVDLTGGALSVAPRLIAAKAETAASLCFTEILLSPPPAPEGQGVTDCIVFAPLHTLSYC